MPSPFPGMDPYLEPHWHAIHTVLVTDTWRLLNRHLPPGLVACVEERVSIESGDAGRVVGRIGPDVRVLAPEGVAGPPRAVVLDAPFKLEPAEEPVVERYVSIVDDEGQLVTVIEFVSPANKRGPGITPFRRNRTDLLASGVHSVEIDLVRAGNWRALMSPEGCPGKAISTYRAIVRTAGDEGAGYLFPIRLPEPLPDVPVPLRPTDAPASLPLQVMLTAVYDDGRYGTRVRYDRPLRPPLPPDDAAWAAALLAGRGR